MKTMMHTTKEKMIAIILTIAMAMAFMPTTAFADEVSESGSEPANKTEAVSENHSSSDNTGSSGGSSDSSSSSESSGSSQKSSSDNGSQGKTESSESKSESTETKSENTESKSESTESGNNESKEDTSAKAGGSSEANENKSAEENKAAEENSDVNADAEKKAENKAEDKDANVEKAPADAVEAAEDAGNEELAEPAKPADIDGEATNDRIRQYNKDVEEYNRMVDEYNKAVDDQYEADVERVKKENEAIEEHNLNEQAKIDEIAQKNAEIQAQYEKDLEQYQNDKAIADRIAEKNNGMTVEQYNKIIEENYNKPADKAIEMNAKAKEVTADQTYEIKEAAVKSGKEVKVKVTHYFDGTGKVYTETFTIDENDTITFKAMGALAETTKPGYASFYYNTDAGHSRGYWVESWSSCMDNAKNKQYGWNCGDTHTISYDKGANHVNDITDIDMEYHYTWIGLAKYKTYNVPNMPTLELIEYTPDFREKLEDPTKMDYLTYLDPKDLLPEPEPADPEPAADPTEPTDPVHPLLNSQEPADEPETPEAPAAPEKPVAPNKTTTADGTDNNRTYANAGRTAAGTMITDTANETPLTASADLGTATTELADQETPLATFNGAWALINLIATILTAAISILLLGFWFIRRREEEEENEEEKTHRKPVLRTLGIIPAITAIIVFLLTEDLTLPMQMVDRYTILMVLILAVEAVIACLCRKTREEKETA